MIGTISHLSSYSNNWSHSPDDSTKPSRINRKRKRRWKISSISDLIKLGLTDCARVAQNLPAGEALPVGRGNLFSKGVNTPQPYVAFLCLLFFTALYRILIMAECFGQPSGWLATFTQYFHPNSLRRPSRGKLDRWIMSLSKGVI